MTTEGGLRPSERGFLGVVLVAIILLVATDLFTDSLEGVRFTHLLVEFGVAVGAAMGLVVVVKDSLRKSRELLVSKLTLAEREQEVLRWRQESQKYVQGLSGAIDQQLVRWGLSPSEKEVALLLLKGLSSKDIAQVRNTAEKTVRTQCVAVYSKSGLAGRSELAAFFLEDLLQPTAAIQDTTI